MKKAIVLFILMASFYVSFAQVNPNQIWIDGYYRQDGTYVRGHYRTVPNDTGTDNLGYPNNLQGEAFVLPSYNLPYFYYPTGVQAYYEQIYSEANTYYNKAIEDYSNNRPYSAIPNFTQAIAIFKKVNYKPPLPYILLAECYALTKNEKKALATIRPATRRVAKNKEACVLIGRVYYYCKNDKSAIFFLKKAISIDKEYKTAYDRIIQVYKDNGKNKQAAKYEKKLNAIL